MSTQTEFDKELEQIINHAIVRSNRNVAPLTVDNEAIKAIKQAVDKYVIGERLERLTITTAASAVSKIINQDSLRNDQRLALWGDK